MSKLPIIRAAAVQAEPIILNLDATVAKACDLIREAAQSGAKLVVFPKMFIPTFVNGSIWGRGLAMWGSKKARSAFVLAVGTLGRDWRCVDGEALPSRTGE